MNCKPGDLAVVVTCTDHKANGKFVHVLQTARVQHPVPDRAGVTFDVRETDGTSLWLVWSAGTPFEEPVYGQTMYAVIHDACLRPIRDPGDDAVDESAAWLPPVPLPAIDPSLIPEKESA